MKTLPVVLRPLVVVGLLGLGIGVIGCQSNSARPAAKAAPAKPRPTGPVPAQFGPAPVRITSVNDQYQFVVLDFSSRALAPLGTKLTVFRDGQRVGVVQITEPTRAQFATADILEGELRVGDEAR